MIEQLFSVVIPLYNKEKSIKSTIDSVLSQNYKNFELIIINDGSTDKSIDVLNSFNDDRIRVINKENGGVSSARNIGIIQSKNDWIALLDADDLWHKDYLLTLEKMISKYPDAKVFATNYNRGNFIPYVEYKKEGYISDYFILAVKYNDILCSSAICINKACFEKVGKFDINLNSGEDLKMWANLGDNFRIAYCPIPLAEYRINAENRLCNIKINSNRSWLLHLKKDEFQSDSWTIYYYFKISSSLVHFISTKMWKNVLTMLHVYGLKTVIKSFKYRKLFR